MERYGNRVAVIGAGPGGLATARYLKAHGFVPVIYEAGDRLGGQWNATGEQSGVWPAMHANTSRVTTRFSDLDYPPETGVFPRNDEVLNYLDAYAEVFGLKAELRLGTTVETLARHPAGGWAVHSRKAGTSPRTELFGRVVVASGRYTEPASPDVPGIRTFAGSAGVSHSFDYQGPEPYAGKTVLVAGCSISALEIASELARSGAGRVIVAMRRQRYVLKKLADGIPADHLGLTRFGALAGESLPEALVAAELKALIVRTSGDPAEFGCPRPAEDVFAAGITLAQDYLDLVAAGRVQPKPWLQGVAGRSVGFVDGSSADVDAIVFGTGFELSLPFLDLKTRTTLGLDDSRAALGLFDHTFHPDLPGLAFVGLLPLIGPYFPVAELQARWVTYAWAGLAPAPSAETVRLGMEEACRGDEEQLAHRVALRFARNAGVEPRLADWPGLARALLFGPLSPISFRLSGPDALPSASWEVMTEAARYGVVTSPAFTDEEIAMLEALAATGGRPEVAAMLASREIDRTDTSRMAA